MTIRHGIFQLPLAGVLIALAMISVSACRETAEQNKPKGKQPSSKLDAPGAESPDGVESPKQNEVILSPSEENSKPSVELVSAPAGPILPRTEERAEERLRMVERQIKALGFRNKQVLEAIDPGAASLVCAR